MKTSARPGKERKSNRPLKVQEFLDSPKPLLELLAEVVKRHAGTCRTGWNAEVIAQYSEVSRTVDRMRENRIPIPREILTLHESLSAQVEKKKHAFECLRAIEECLGRMHPEVATLVARLTTARKKTGPRKITRKRTSQAILQKEIVKALRELGGKAPKAEVLEQIAANMRDRFKPLDLEKDSQGTVNWERWAGTERNTMVRKGILKAGTTHGIWELARAVPGTSTKGRNSAA